MAWTLAQRSLGGADIDRQKLRADASYQLVRAETGEHVCIVEAAGEKEERAHALGLIGMLHTARSAGI